MRQKIVPAFIQVVSLVIMPTAAFAGDAAITIFEKTCPNGEKVSISRAKSSKVVSEDDPEIKKKIQELPKGTKLVLGEYVVYQYTLMLTDPHGKVSGPVWHGTAYIPPDDPKNDPIHREEDEIKVLDVTMKADSLFIVYAHYAGLYVGRMERTPDGQWSKGKPLRFRLLSDIGGEISAIASIVYLSDKVFVLVGFPAASRLELWSYEKDHMELQAGKEYALDTPRPVRKEANKVEGVKGSADLK